jgi:hypothetical protein
MRISSSDLTQGLDRGGAPAKTPRSEPADAGSQPYQTTDSLAISATASAASSAAERIHQLKVQLDSGEYHPSSLAIAQKLIHGALARND